MSEKVLNPPNHSKLYPKHFLRRYLDPMGITFIESKKSQQVDVVTVVTWPWCHRGIENCKIPEERLMTWSEAVHQGYRASAWWNALGKCWGKPAGYEKPWGKTGKMWWKMLFWIENGKTHVILLGKCWENPKKTCLFWIETGKLSSMDGDLPVRAHRNLKHVQMPQAFLQKWENSPTLRSRA